MTDATERFRQARDRLVELRDDYATARAEFAWPRFEHFNFAEDWFDAVAAGPRADEPALWVVDDGADDQQVTWAEMARRSRQVASWLRGLGVRRGDRVLLMLGNQVELWETILACIRLGAVMIPCTPLLGTADLRDRVERGDARHAVVGAGDTGKLDGVEGAYTRVAVPGRARTAVPEGWHDYDESRSAADVFEPDGPTGADDTLLLYFTSGTTSRPKLVEHTHTSYPVGHLTTAYWIGLEPGDVHLNISSPGWAKHAWSNVFAPWIAEATILVVNQPRFDAAGLLAVVERVGVTSFCAPPTVWRMLIQSDLASLRNPPTKVVGAGEPLNPEVIAQVEQAWGVTIRDGFGQTETTVMVSNSPGQRVVPGAMGRPLPGYPVVLLDPATGERLEGDDVEGEICIDLADRPVGLMVGYHGDPERDAEAMRDGCYHTGDVARRDADGYLTYVGRSDDVFKASDYRISPFELESVLIEHPAVAEAAVVPSPDPLRLAVPKAYVVLVAGHEPSAETARSVFAHSREHLAPFKRVRRLEFAELPKTISGKIRRVELRASDARRHPVGTERVDGEFWEDDFPDLRG